jgi:hypothetical protein
MLAPAPDRLGATKVLPSPRRALHRLGRDMALPVATHQIRSALFPVVRLVKLFGGWRSQRDAPESGNTPLSAFLREFGLAPA